MTALTEILSENTRQGELYEKLADNRVHCYACGHNCTVFEGLPGVCKVRFNRGGELYVPWGYAAGVQCDPVEKKPFFHVRPGAMAYSFGMLGCDLHCGYCQNWVTSQTLRDPQAIAMPRPITPDEVAEQAIARGGEIVVSTYNEPLITSEWAVAVFRAARDRGLLTGYVSNGNATPRVLEYIRPYTDLYKVDLKSFNDRHYRDLGGRLEPVLDSIRLIFEMGFWLEIVTLVIPGFNDSDAELSEIASFIAALSPAIPWHVTAFHQDYKMTTPADTTAAGLLRAARIGRAAGLHYVYAGNLPGRVNGFEDTRCPHCEELLIQRRGYRVLEYHLTKEGCCPRCAAAIPGIWRTPA